MDDIIKKLLSDATNDNELELPAEDNSDFAPMLPMGDMDEEKLKKIPNTLPVLPLKNTVLFPGVVIPITVGREKSLKAINKANKGKEKLIAVVSQKDPDNEDPRQDDLFPIGTVARLVKVLKLPDGSTTVIIQGRGRISLNKLTSASPCLEAEVTLLPENPSLSKLEFEAAGKQLRELAVLIVERSPNIPNEAAVMVRNIGSDEFLMHFIASNLDLNTEERQTLLEIDNMQSRLEAILKAMHKQLQSLELRGEIENRVKIDLDKQQRDYILNQQLKTIQDELGQSGSDEELEEIIEKAKNKKWPEEAQKAFDKEVSRVRRTNPQAPEFAILMNYLEMMVELPWDEYTEDNFNLKSAAEKLNHDHYGLEKVKDRILEHLAVLKLKGNMKAPILCLSGPPGVGKTSLGRSIADALGRKYIRMSLGGLHDESEVRGHRRTYIGAMPGRILQSLRKAGSNNPVFILDEIDKVSNSFRGDPSSALLEVLDPEQNSTFHDNYLDIDYDLSKVLFIATANNLQSIQPALLDRMEIIEVDGYSAEEKVEIASRHLVPKQLEEHGLDATQAQFPKELLTKIIRRYTRESGVRELNRQIANALRHVARKVAEETPIVSDLSKSDIKDLLGPERYSMDEYTDPKQPGVAVGLAWTQVGGDILFIESSLHKGEGKLTLTGNLGDVMKESVTTALSYIRAHAEELNINPELFKTRDIHVHVPAGAIPKDGPSAGITMLSALTSAFTGRPVKPYLCMTGEITLRGRVLPVGGIKEKILAAKRAELTEAILCVENEKDVLEINPSYIQGMTFHYVRNMDEVLKLALI